jgi:hypothetical protein
VGAFIQDFLVPSLSLKLVQVTLTITSDPTGASTSDIGEF